MVVKALIKRGLKKKPKPKPKPIPRYRTDPKTGQKFLNKRRTASGVKDGTKAPVSKSFVRGAITGSAASYMLTDTLKNKKVESKSMKDKLKEATEKHIKKDKKKKEKNYGGR